MLRTFNGFTLSNVDQGLFAESYLFDFNEVKHLIPEKHRYLFKDTDRFNGASGFVEFDEGSADHEYVLILLTDEDYSKALLLCLQEIEGDEEKTIILHDFLCS